MEYRGLILSLCKNWSLVIAEHFLSEIVIGHILIDFYEVDRILYLTEIAFELICIDDGSSDSSIEILKSYQSKDKMTN